MLSLLPPPPPPPPPVQLDVAQYSNCNCTTGSPCQKIGECYGIPSELRLEISANSTTIGAAPVYEAGRKYYFSSECVCVCVCVCVFVHVCAGVTVWPSG